MPWPAPLSRNNPNVHKNDFGHVLILAGSRNMLGAAALSGLAAMRAGAGLVTIGIPKNLNLTLQKKISPVIMTLPLPETKEGTLATAAFSQLQRKLSSCNVLALGPGLSQNKETQRLIRKIIASSPNPLLIDADGLNALVKHTDVLDKSRSLKILTPHPGEMTRLTGLSRETVEKKRKDAARNFAKKHRSIVVLKGHQTVIAAFDGKIYVNKTGNAGMATAGSEDVLTGIIAAFLAQGLNGFEAAKYGVYLHGRAGDLAAKRIPKVSLIATDLIDFIPKAFKSFPKIP